MCKNPFFSGTHRALWPIYGEYKFLPKQRWLHSMEVIILLLITICKVLKTDISLAWSSCYVIPSMC